MGERPAIGGNATPSDGDLGKRWLACLRRGLETSAGAQEGARLFARYTSQLPSGYARTTPVHDALTDIAALESLRVSGQRAVFGLREGPDEAGHARVVLYNRGHGIELSSVLPALESFGFVVVNEVSNHFGDPTAGDGHVSDFGVRAENGGELVRLVDVEGLEAAATMVWRGHADADALNRLVVSAGLGWRDVAVLRAYRRYRRQLGTRHSESYLDGALTSHPAVAAALVELFRARLEPTRIDNDGEVVRARRAVVEACDVVERFDVDRILRDFLALVEATVRTNRWVSGPTGGPPAPLVLKFDSRAVPDTPQPVPYREVFVTSPTVEGVHLRGGHIARGGVRWSDRMEDYRTEVLGLMKTQMVKNALIAPTGAKGGFVLRRGAGPAAVRAGYEAFVRGLLDVTDNVVDGAIIGPAGVRARDGVDPYLVIAADKGTATFSDLANEIGADYGFWLGDAFASGGSRGYDHKALGITARGAWVAARQHFRELGVDIDTEPVTVVGIGDMSGDVFGNAMLHSPHLKLVAAFDHRDVFLDPDPDPQTAYEERRRLFSLPESSWQDYDASLISDGGGVWPRTSKRIPLTPQVRRRLGVEDDVLTPPEVVKAIMGASVDLLYAGGIGTFVKGIDETHDEVGDRANDDIRVDADDVGARVVVEGGNLAVTQRGRIEYAQRGGRINTDAIDNAAGVDISDHEVNLKVLLSPDGAGRDLTGDDRDRVLEDVTDDVVGAVLEDMGRQTRALAAEGDRARGEDLNAYKALVARLEEHPGTQNLDRLAESLPDHDEMTRRAAQDGTLTRPELAVLLAYTKAQIAERIHDAPLPPGDLWRDVLVDYYPSAVADGFAGRLAPSLLPLDLGRAVVATRVANDVVNRMGMTFAHRVAEDLQVDVVTVVRAYWASRAISDADAMWRRIERLDGAVDTWVQRRLETRVADLVAALTRNYLRAPLTDLDDLVRRERPAFTQLARNVSDDSRTAAWRHQVDEDVALGVDDDLARSVADLRALVAAPDIAAVARDTNRPVVHVAQVFRRLDGDLPFERIETALAEAVDRGPWARLQRRGLFNDLRWLRRSVAQAALLTHPHDDPRITVGEFLRCCRPTRDLLTGVMRDLDAEAEASLPAVEVAVRALREVAIASVESCGGGPASGHHDPSAASLDGAKRPAAVTPTGAAMT